MFSQERWLPLFPLNTVLFPGASIPLQIFEERYKQMMEHCMDGDKRFGVILIKSGSEVGEPAIPHSTGTVAHIVQVNRADEGRMFIAVTGVQRFQISNITQHRPYMAADVVLLEEDADAWVPPTEMEALRRELSQHITLTLGLRGGWKRAHKTASNPVVLSYFIAGILEAGLQEKQALLEEPSTSKRLEIELDLLRREAEVMKRRVAQELRSRFSRQ